MNRGNLIVVLLALMAAWPSPLPAASGEMPVPASKSRDKGKYFLVDFVRAGDVVSATHKRVGKGFNTYTKTETNCANMQMREMGFSDESAEAIIPAPTRWFEPEAGTIKSDVAKFVCKQAG